MKKAFCFLMVLCMALPCAAISAEEKHLEGSPWINSSWYGNWPGERPGPEEDFALYANFDFFQDALSSGKEQDTSRASDTIEQNNRDMVALCLDTSQTGPEEDILRTMYALFNDTQKREEDGLKPLLALTDRVRETKTTEEFIALLGEEGFLPGNVIVSWP